MCAGLGVTARGRHAEPSSALRPQRIPLATSAQPYLSRGFQFVPRPSGV